jgi:hypothetical protein
MVQPGQQPLPLGRIVGGPGKQSLFTTEPAYRRTNQEAGLHGVVQWLRAIHDRLLGEFSSTRMEAKEAVLAAQSAGDGRAVREALGKCEAFIEASYACQRQAKTDQVPAAEY